MSAQRKRKAPVLEATTELDTENPLSGIDGECTGENGFRMSKRKKAGKVVSEVSESRTERAPSKRKQPTARAKGKAKTIATTTSADADALAQPHTMLDKISSESLPIVVEAESQSVNTPVEQEHRAARWRKKPPVAVAERIERCMVQRMFVIGREPVEGSDPPEEKFMMAGTTGNIYTIHINHKPNCNCPDGRKNGTCKHILYVMIKVLRARSDLSYQIALTNSELREIFKNCPARSTTVFKSTRKPLDEDDCPICYFPMEPNQPTVWCSAMCGTNLHRDCFQQWAASKSTGPVTCVMCRTPWVSDMELDVEKATTGEEGYKNVAEQLGLSRERGYSYSNRWRRSY